MLTDFQRKQIEIIDDIEKQVDAHSLTFSTVAPVKDFGNDTRVCLTSVHFPHENLISNVTATLIEPLRKIESNFYYYPKDSLHITIKNIRVIADPPNFTENDIRKANRVFSEIIPIHKKCTVYFYRLLLFPNNLALIGTTDPELDDIILGLDRALSTEGIPDDKIYVNSKYFFSNMTLARFSTAPSGPFKQKVRELSDSLACDPYTIDSVTLLSSNAVMEKRAVLGTWYLK